MVELADEDADTKLLEADRARIAQGKQWLAEHGGEGISMEAVLAEFGLSRDDLPLAK